MKTVFFLIVKIVTVIESNTCPERFAKEKRKKQNQR